MGHSQHQIPQHTARADAWSASSGTSVHTQVLLEYKENWFAPQPTARTAQQQLAELEQGSSDPPGTLGLPDIPRETLPATPTFCWQR